MNDNQIHKSGASSNETKPSGRIVQKSKVIDQPTDSMLIEAGEIKEQLRELRDQFREVIYNPTGDVSQEPNPFTLRKLQDGTVLLFLPRNFDEMASIPLKVGIAEMISEINCMPLKTSKDLITKANQEADNFFIGLFRTLVRAPEENELPSFSVGDALAKGATQAKLYFLKTLYKDFGKIQNYLPNECFYSAGRLEYIHFYLSELIVENDIILHKQLKENILRLFMKYVRIKMDPKWEMLKNYRIPVGKIFEGIYQYKEKMVKGKKKFIAVKPKRPSERIEILYPQEVQFLEGFEASFKAFKKLSDSLKDGCQLSDAEKKSIEASQLTQDRWNVVKKFSAAFSYRNKVLTRLARELKIKKGLTNQTVKQISLSIMNNEFNLSEEDKLNLSSFAIVDAANTGNTTAPNGFKMILLGKSLKKSADQLGSWNYHLSDLIDLLDANLSLLYIEEEKPKYKRYLPREDLEEEDAPNIEVVVDQKVDEDSV